MGLTISVKITQTPAFCGSRSFEEWQKNVCANVMVTTACDQACPDCCVGDVVLRAKPRIFKPEDIARDVKALGAVGTVILLGGEPTLHPQFEEVARLCREARGSMPMRLISNGSKLLKKFDALKYFDRVDMSIFTEQSNTGWTTDPTIVPAVRLKGLSTFNPYEVIHTNTQGKGACGRELDTISTMDGQVYSCCVAHGMFDAESTDLSPGWEYRLRSVPLPCEKCVFGVPC